ncbi:MAG TPA: ComF family protein [Myxococcota bacterium]|nr:ComF family protein [Myxococcota bacterium]HRY96760.1 ComF family protein [Myxococcota bacterium]HSA24266.1 ComF family protein [Myxococcota bacterium]
MSPAPPRARLLGLLCAPLDACQGLLDLLLPPACGVCQALLDERREVLCPNCAAELEPLGGALCGRCGLPGADPCPACRGEPGPLSRLRSGWAYEGALQQAILRMKLGRRIELAEDLGARLAARALPGWEWQELELLAPIPLHPRRLHARGFNQAAVIARALARAHGLPLSLDHLVRTRATPEQARAQDRAARLANVRGAFAVRAGHPFAGRCVCLVDDVVTTGATLHAAAEALLAAGAREVRGLSVARTL